ncbi:galectin-7-like [Erinaceus europaeus]|uniref:Galectin n=1 Tax=Erinaceus europaeus TaxID=9365 RepID=A0A1S3WCA6_ERIEU|nr:galectin-7-like [Erinaceus europaeus]
MAQTSSARNVPYVISLPNGIELGAMVKIRGTVPENADRFQIDLMCSKGQEPDIALHFNPRFDQNKVVFNSRKSGSWGTEEYGHDFPFRHRQAFEVLIITDQEGFKVVIGDQKYHHFRYRIPLSEVCGLEVSGKVMLESVNIF